MQKLQIILIFQTIELEVELHFVYLFEHGQGVYISLCGSGTLLIDSYFVWGIIKWKWSKVIFGNVSVIPLKHFLCPVLSFQSKEVLHILTSTILIYINYVLYTGLDEMASIPTAVENKSLRELKHADRKCSMFQNAETRVNALRKGFKKSL